MVRTVFLLLWFLFVQNINGQIFYGNSVENFQQGLSNQGASIIAVRSNPIKSLGAPEKSDIETGIPNFVSLGFGGSIIIKTNPVPVTVLTQISVFETTFSYECSAYPEEAKIYVSKDGIYFELIGETCGNENTIFSLYTRIDTVNYIKIEDISDTTGFNSSLIADGYDVDGIEIFDLTPLAIELDFFNAKISGGLLFVEFRTLTETGTLKFEIQESKNAIDFRDLNLIFNAANYSSLPRLYEGSIPYQASEKIVYIRLKETDLDGKSFYFKVVPVFNPNSQNVEWEFYDLLGRRVSQGEFNLRYK
jgi:hypothetical protein